MENDDTSRNMTFDPPDPEQHVAVEQLNAMLKVDPTAGDKVADAASTLLIQILPQILVQGCPLGVIVVAFKAFIAEHEAHLEECFARGDEHFVCHSTEVLDHLETRTLQAYREKCLRIDEEMADLMDEDPPKPVLH